MKKWQLATTSLVALTMMGGLVAGCGSTNNTSGGNTATNSTGAASTIPTGQTITVWSWAGGDQLTDVKKIAQAWATQHGDTVNVIDESTNPKGFQSFATAARAGSGPDVLIGMPHDNNGTFVQEGLLAQVPDGTINPSDYTQSEIDAVTVNGKMYSVPVSVQTTALFYNTDMIPNAPTDWNGFVDDANKHGFMFDLNNLYFDYAFIGGMGGYVFKNNNGTLDPTDIGLANDGSVQAFQLMRDMVNKYHWMAANVTGAIAKQQFINKKIGMYISGPWDTSDLKKAGIHYSIAPLPTLSNGQPATPFMGVITAFVNARADQSKSAGDWDLLKALTNADAQKAYFADSQQIPTLTALQQSPDIQSNAYVKAFADQVKNAVPMPNIPQMQAVWTAMSVIGNITKGSVDPATGAKDFVQNIQKGIAVQGN